jgi:hypothetical protein
MKFHGSISGIHEPKRHMKAHNNSQTGWNFIEACQQFTWSPGSTQQLTRWVEFHNGISAIYKLRRHTATHKLDRILHVGDSNRAEGTQKLTGWMRFHKGMSMIQIKPRRHTKTYRLNEIS